MLNIKTINILDLMKHMGESFVQKQLSLFSSPCNPEIENFLKCSAINFAKRGLSITYLIFESNSFQLLGYFTLTYKILNIEQGNISRTTEKRVACFGDFNETTNTYSLAAPIIAQFGKNYSPLIPQKITGNFLMQLAINQLYVIQHLIGGRIIYLECEDNPFLLDFYIKNGFVPTSKRFTQNEDNVSFYHQLIRIVR